MRCEICGEEKDSYQMKNKNICNICNYYKTSKKEAETDKEKFKKARNKAELKK